MVSKEKEMKSGEERIEDYRIRFRKCFSLLFTHFHVHSGNSVHYLYHFYKKGKNKEVLIVIMRNEMQILHW